MVINGMPPQPGGLNGVHHNLNGTPPGPAGPARREAAYSAALKLVARIDEDLARGIRHYRDNAGRLLTQLDEVIRAILANNLLLKQEEEGEV